MTKGFFGQYQNDTVMTTCHCCRGYQLPHGQVRLCPQKLPSHADLDRYLTISPARAEELAGVWLAHRQGTFARLEQLTEQAFDELNQGGQESVSDLGRDDP